MTPEEIAAAEAAQQAADAAKQADEKAKADAEAKKTYDEAYVKGLRTEAQNYRLKLKEYEQAEEARKQSEMTETQKLQARAEAAEKKARDLEIQHVRTKAAAKHQLPDDLHEFITAEDEAGAQVQAEKLAAKLVKQASGNLPPSGNRNPANAGEQGKAQDEADRFDAMRSRVPALNNRVLKR